MISEMVYCSFGLLSVLLFDYFVAHLSSSDHQHPFRLIRQVQHRLTFLHYYFL